MSRPRVTIITPTYNHEKFISDCIISVINQSYSNWDMIIIDDASTDKTFHIIKQFAIKDKRIKMIRHKKNWGIKRLKDTYNQALKLSSGSLIAILEGDDLWPKDKLEKQVSAFEDNEVVLSYGNWVIVNQSGNKIYTRSYGNKNYSSLNNYPIGLIFELFLTLRFAIGSQTVMIKKNALIDINGFKNSPYYPFVDIPTYLYLALKGKFKYIPFVLGFHRRTSKSQWFKFVSKAPAVSTESIRQMINTFIKKQANNIYKVKDWNAIEKQQNLYIILRKIVYPLSAYFNRFLCK